MIGKNIYEIRKRRGFTLSELAERANISKSYLSNIERDINRNPSIQVIKKVADVLGVDLKELLKPESGLETGQLLEKEWVDFINDLKESGLHKEQIHEYKTVFDFIKWQNEKNDREN